MGSGTPKPRRHEADAAIDRDVVPRVASTMLGGAWSGPDTGSS